MFKKSDITKDLALAIIRAAVGGRSPNHGDTLLFQAGSGDTGLGLIWAPGGTNVNPDVPDDDDDDDGSSGGSGGSGGIVNIYNRIVANFHDDDGNAPRVNALCNIWLGSATPINHQTPDLWVKFAE